MNVDDPFLETILPIILFKQLINKCSHDAIRNFQITWATKSQSHRYPSNFSGIHMPQ
jgi:hypothetical protein